eukprot:6184963-Pleurochrysis_carterae.AAC.1
MQGHVWVWQNRNVELKGACGTPFPWEKDAHCGGGAVRRPRRWRDPHEARQQRRVERRERACATRMMWRGADTGGGKSSSKA